MQEEQYFSSSYHSPLKYPNAKLCILLATCEEMKFLKKKLHARLKVRSSKKRKRDDSDDEMAIEKVVAKVVEWIESVSPTSSTRIALMLESIFKITKTSPNVEVEVSNQLVEEGTDASLEAESGSHPAEKSKAGPRRRWSL